MTVRPDQLTESARRLYDDFRGAGLSEAAAVQAATDGLVADQLLGLQIAETFGSVSRADARLRQAKILEAAAARWRGHAAPAAAPGQQAVSEAEVDALLARVFKGGA